MVQEIELVEIDIDGRTFWVRPVGSWVLKLVTVVPMAIAPFLNKTYPELVDCVFVSGAHKQNAM